MCMGDRCMQRRSQVSLVGGGADRIPGGGGLTEFQGGGE